MSRLRFAILSLLLVCGCGQQAAQPLVQQKIPLSEARKDHKTKLMRKASTGEPFQKPPSGLFRAVQFDSPAGKLAAYVTLDPKDGKKHPAIVWITGGDCSTIDESVWAASPPDNDQTARQYREAGIAMMFPSLRGGNQNPGFHEGFYGEVDDVAAAAEFLSKQPFVDPQRIYLGGHSSGATMVLLAAECSPRFRAVFSISPTHDLRAYPAEYNALFQPFDTSDVREFELRSPGYWLNSVQSPTFVLAGTTLDGALPSVRLMSQSLTNPKVHFLTVTGAGHFNILAPTNRLIAEKILRDDGPECGIALTTEELSGRFAGKK